MAADATALPYFRSRFQAFAHRGGRWPGAGENSPTAFRRAAESGFSYLETDVHATADGELVAFHDTCLDRVTDGHGLIAEHTVAGLAELRIEGGDPIPRLADQLAELSRNAQLTPVAGPAVTVTLSDAPLSVKPAGVPDELLIVHQQDIQAVVNAMWQGGAEAMTIQGQRVTAQTGVKCVGNTVVLHGVPYAPPYVITAIGDQVAIERALESSTYLQTYREYVAAYRLGYSQEREADVTLPGYQGSLELRYARLARTDR